MKCLCLTFSAVVGIVPRLHIRLAEENEHQIAEEVNSSRNEEHVSPLSRIALVVDDESDEQRCDDRHNIGRTVGDSHERAGEVGRDINVIHLQIRNQNETLFIMQ